MKIFKVVFFSKKYTSSSSLKNIFNKIYIIKLMNKLQERKGKENEFKMNSVVKVDINLFSLIKSHERKERKDSF